VGPKFYARQGQKVVLICLHREMAVDYLQGLVTTTNKFKSSQVLRLIKQEQAES
jgi:hypothetical protein